MADLLNRAPSETLPQALQHLADGINILAAKLGEGDAHALAERVHKYASRLAADRAALDEVEPAADAPAAKGA